MNTERSAQIKDLLKKYREGKCTSEEQARVEAWYASLAQNKGADRSAENAAVKNIRQNVLRGTGRQASVYRLMLPYLKGAAAVLIFPLAYWLYIALNKPATVAEQQFSTRNGEVKMITLPDSTEVMLNAASTLTVSADFNEKRRNVKLSGEAYFRVKHDTTRPFIVATGKLQTQVLGTEFNVHAYGAEDNIKVAVVKGRVKVSEEQHNGDIKQLGRVLTHNLMLNYNISSGKHLIKTTDAGKLSNWQTGGAYFEEASISEIAQALSRHYNHPIQLIDKPAKGCRYTIDLSGESLPRALDVLGQLTGITYQYTQNKTTIHAKNCH